MKFLEHHTLLCMEIKPLILKEKNCQIFERSGGRIAVEISIHLFSILWSKLPWIIHANQLSKCHFSKVILL